VESCANPLEGMTIAGIAPFEFTSAGRIVFGRGVAGQVAQSVAAFGRRAVVVVGRDPSRPRPFLDSLSLAGVEAETFSVPTEPTIDQVRRGTLLARQAGVEVVVGLGGGSALDAAKAIAILATHDGDVLDYLEVIGAGKSFIAPGLPMVAVPTTAGTGSEVTRNAVLGSPEHRVKVSLRSHFLLPRLALVDPALSSDMPPALTARTGCDALTQLIEPFVSVRAGPMTDALCREGLRLASRSLRRAFQEGSDPEARDEMALASTLSGLALANAGLGVVHGLAGPIGGMIAAPHGAICAALLPGAMEVNLRALRARDPHSPALPRYDELGRWLTGRRKADAADGAGWTADLCRDLEIPRLSTFGLTESLLPVIIERAQVASSTRTNPVTLLAEELTEIVRRAM
jgi:alcohol dehydrogenase class IV